MHGLDPQHLLDLRGATCPMAFVKTRIHLDKLAPGDSFKILYEPTPPNEPLLRSIRSLGHCILSEATLMASELPDPFHQGPGTPPSADTQLTIVEVEVKP